MFHQTSSKNMYKLMIFNLIILSIICLKGSISISVVGRPYCPDGEYNKTCCHDDEFQCANNGYCIPQDGLCDGVKNCEDNSDEIECYNITCEDRKIYKCDQICTDASKNHSRCTCRDGFTFKPNFVFSFAPAIKFLIEPASCQDVDECKIGTHICTQDCQNGYGTYSCTCKKGFRTKIGSYGRTCEAIDDNVKILYSSDNWIYSYSKKTHKVTPVLHAGKVDAMEYDPANDMVYWTTKNNVARSYLPGAKGGKVAVGHAQSIGPASISHSNNSLTIDWTEGNMYWLSVHELIVERYQIRVSKVDGRYVKTLVDNIFCASSLVVDPESGMMYWTSGGEQAEIGASWMNGQNRLNLHSLTTQNPIALTLDHLGNRFYWADSKTNVIYSMFKDGTRPTEIIKTDELNSPLMMDVFENYLYWVTKGSNELVMHDKFGRGGSVTLVSNLINQTSIKVQHKDRVVVNVNDRERFCETECSHLCLHIPNGYNCACPDGSRMVLVEDRIICDTESVDPLEDPLMCDCSNKDDVCNMTSPLHECFCPNIIVCVYPEAPTENKDDFSNYNYE